MGEDVVEYLTHALEVSEKSNRAGTKEQNIVAEVGLQQQIMEQKMARKKSIG